MTEVDAKPPAGFEPYGDRSPFLDRIGPLFQKDGVDGPVFGLRILAHHANRRGMPHGGLLVTVADIALGKTAAWSTAPATPLLTASITVDFVGAARLGDWVEASTDFHRVGRELAFTNCYLTVGEKRIARASAVFKVVRRSTGDRA
ncbi:MAG: PaaI family thioesterase [Minwuiales bacterium]|nr:PaaI family thioesterase [Minwuiales bacterium]